MADIDGKSMARHEEMRSKMDGTTKDFVVLDDNDGLGKSQEHKRFSNGMTVGPSARQSHRVG